MSFSNREIEDFISEMNKKHDRFCDSIQAITEEYKRAYVADMKKLFSMVGKEIGNRAKYMNKIEMKKMKNGQKFDKYIVEPITPERRKYIIKSLKGLKGKALFEQIGTLKMKNYLTDYPKFCVIKNAVPSIGNKHLYDELRTITIEERTKR